jgi:hypothetical protein
VTLWNRVPIKVSNGVLAGSQLDITQGDSQIPDFILRCRLNVDANKKNEWTTLHRPLEKAHHPYIALVVIEGKPSETADGFRQACIAALACIHQRLSLGEAEPYVFFGDAQGHLINLYLMRGSNSTANTTIHRLPDLSFDLGTFSGCAKFLVFSEVLKQHAGPIVDATASRCNHLEGTPEIWWNVKRQKQSSIRPTAGSTSALSIPGDDGNGREDYGQDNVGRGYLTSESGTGLDGGSDHQRGRLRCNPKFTHAINWVKEKTKRITSGAFFFGRARR